MSSQSAHSSAFYDHQPQRGHPEDEKLWPLEFILVSALAGIAVGVLIGILIMCLYRKLSCLSHAQSVPHGIPARDYHCYPVNHECEHLDGSQPVFAIAEGCHCEGHPRAFSPPPYQSNNGIPNRLQSHCHHARAFEASHIRSSLDNLSGRQTPQSMARSHHSDLDQTRLSGSRNALTTGSAQHLSPIASMSDREEDLPVRVDPSRQRRNTCVGTRAEGQQRRSGPEEETISMNELSSGQVEPQVFLREAPALDPNSFLEPGNEDCPQASNDGQHNDISGHQRQERLNVMASGTHSEARGTTVMPAQTQTDWSAVNLFQRDDNLDKHKASKQIPFGSIGLPTSRRHFPCVDPCEIEDLKIFATYPEDIQTIFKPIDCSKMIMVRQKKIVYDCKRLNSNGGVLQLDNMGISLVVPPGAIPYGQSGLVTLVLNWDLSDNPNMSKREALISPVVYCGPHSTTFQRPCVLKFKHCAFDNRCAQIMTSETDLFDDKAWTDFGANNDNVHADESVQEDTLDSPPTSNVMVGVDECQVEVTHFSLYTCIQRPKYPRMKKWLQVAVFTHDMGTSLQHQSIRVYFLNKTPCAMQWAIQNEASYGFRLACPENSFLFEELGEDMMVRLSYLSQGWSMVSKEMEGETSSVMFEQIWHGACPHVCLCFKRSFSLDGRAICNETYPKDSSSLVQPDDTLGVARYEEGAVTTETKNGDLRDEKDGGSADSEIFIDLRLSQWRCENIGTNVRVLLHQADGAKVTFPSEETPLKTVD